MPEPLPLFALYLRERFTSAQTIRSYERTAAAFERWREARARDRSSVESFLGRVRADGGVRAEATRKRELMALRMFFAFGEKSLGWEAGGIERIPVIRVPVRDPAVPSAGEVQAFFKKLAEERDEMLRVRNLALVGVLALAGLRVHELVALNIEQVDLDHRVILAVQGKGGTLHDVVVSDALARLLRSWLATRADTHGPLFVARSTGARLSVRAVEALVASTRRGLGLKRRISPHSFRHAFATLTLERGADLSTVAALLRHQNLSSTRRYVHLQDATKRAAVERLSSLIPVQLTAQTPPPNEAICHPHIEGDPPCEEPQFCEVHLHDRHEERRASLPFPQIRL